jgi:uncharacterized protein involved in exopolysaccharide biosynthesis
MDQEIDLREIIALLLKHKYRIVGLAVAAAMVAAIVSLLLPPVYQATALVAVTKPQYELQFDARIRSLSSNLQPPYKAYPILASSDKVASALLSDARIALANGERTIPALRAKLDAESGTDPSIIRLTVQDGDPQRAAAIANAWAEHFVESANELYNQSSGELDFFTEQQAEAESALTEAEQALIDFQERNRAAILETQLTHARETLDTTLAAAHALQMTVEDARALSVRLRAQHAGAPASSSDELAALLIEVNALSHSSSDMQLQLATGQDLGDKTVGDQIALLDSLMVALEGRLAQLEAEAQALEPEILALQEAYQQARVDQDRLQRAESLARDTYDSLARKAAEARIAAQDTTGEVRLASRATPLDDPIAPRKALNTVGAGVIGLLVAIVAVIAVDYWRRGQ